MAYKFQDGFASFDGEISGSAFRTAGSLSGSGDVAVTGAVHAATLFGNGAGITNVSAEGIDVTSSTGDLSYKVVFTEAFQNDGTIGLGGNAGLIYNPTDAILSSSAALSLIGALNTIGNIGTTGSITAGTTLDVGTALDVGGLANLDGGIEVDSGGNKFTVSTAGAVSASSTLEVVGAITSIGAIASTGSITAGSSFVIGSADLNEADMEKLDGITNGTAAAAKAVVLDASKNIATIGTVGCGAITSTGASTMGSLNVGGTLACDTSFTIDAVVLNATELGYVDGVTAGTAVASKAVVLDASKNIATIGTVGCGAITSTGASSFGSISSVAAVTMTGLLSSSAGAQIVGNSIFGGTVDISGNIEVADSTTMGIAADTDLLTFNNAQLTVAGDLLATEGTISGASTLQAVGDTFLCGQMSVSGGVRYQMSTITSNTELSASTSTMYHMVSGGTSNITVILPSASAGENYQYAIKRHTLMSGNVILEGGGAELIDGETNVTLSTVNAAVFLISDGTQWNIF